MVCGLGCAELFSPQPPLGKPQAQTNLVGTQDEAWRHQGARTLSAGSHPYLWYSSFQKLWCTPQWALDLDVLMLIISSNSKLHPRGSPLLLPK